MSYPMPPAPSLRAHQQPHAPPHGQQPTSRATYSRAASMDGSMMFPASSPHLKTASSFTDVTSASATPATTRAAPQTSSLPSSRVSEIARQASMASASAPPAHAAQLRERSNSWAVTSSMFRNSTFPNSGHVMDTEASQKLTREVNKAVKVVDTFLSPKLLKDESIPSELLIEAYGLVFLTVYKVGFLFSGKVGTGFVISRTTGGWSAPSFISSGGLGFGMMAGGEMVNYMIILNSRSAVKVFTRNGQFQLGSELDIAVGPIGRAASAAVNVGRGGIAPNYSYSHSMGLYGGIGLTSAVICTRKSLNAKCYGSNVTARQILGGEIPCPLAVPLWEALDRALGVRREYLNGLPVLHPSVAEVACDACGFFNSTERQQCARCRSLLVYSVSVHSGRRSASQLIVSNHGASAAPAQTS